MACIPPVIEKRPLKKPKIGVPDIYPQEFKQREDELSAINVKQGYFDNPSYLEEYGSARPYIVSADILLNSFNLIQKRKKDVNTFQDSNKKKPVLNIKDIFWPVTARSKSSSDSWFKDLACNKSLILLAKKVPIFNKKEELFAQLFESNVPFSRAVWVIKLNAAYTSAMAENKIKKRQILDPYSDWTQALCRYMKELIGRLSLSYKRADNSLTVSSTYESSIPKTCDSFQTSSMETASYFGNYSNTLNVTSPGISTLGASLNFKNGSTLFSPNPSSLISPLGQDSFFNDSLPGFGGKDNFTLVATQNSHTGIINSSGHESSLSFAANPSRNNLSNNKENMWDYMETLAWYMFREGLLDNQEYLTFVCEILEKGLIDADIDKNDHILDPLLPFALKYAQSFAKSYFLARRMAYLCAAKLSELLAMANPAKQETSTDPIPSSGERLGSELVRIGNYLPTPSTTQSQNEVYGLDLGKYFHNCPHHRHLALNLSCILQVILYACPSAMVWNDILGWSNNTNAPGTTTPLNPAYLLGSPLDHLPMAPSELPIMVYPGQIIHIKKCLMDEEEHIRLRSEAAENLWSIEKDNKSSVGKVINRILKVLQALDQHDYGKNEPENSVDILYRRIFNPLPEYEEYVEDDIKEILNHDEPIVFILCQWAISLQRRGLHRSMVVSHLLRMRQDEYDEIFGGGDEGDTDTSYPPQDLVSEGVSNELREALSLEPTLMKFLDLYAPTLQDNNRESIEMFLNLVLLYGELIRSNVFRYERYLKSLICRNEIDTSNVQMPTWPLHMSQKTIEKNRKQAKNTNDFMSPTSSGHQHSSQNNVIQDAPGFINEGFDNVDPTAKSTGSNLVYFHYPFSNLGFYKTKMPDFHRATTCGGTKRFSKHYQFLYHFPLFEPDSLAETDQRLNLLFGVGKFKALVKSELCSLTRMAKKIFFACENFYDPTAPETVSDKGGDVFDSTVFKERLWHFYERLNRFPLFDKVTVLNACTQLLIRSFQRFADGISRSLVRLESVMAIFECLGKIRNYRALVESLTDAFIELPRIQARLASSSNLASAPSGLEFGNTSTYALLLCTRLVGVARFYFPCLVTCTDTGILFKALLAFSRAMGEIPQGCSSSFRITYSFMFDLWSSCQAVRNCCPPLLAESSHHLVSEIKRVMYGIVAPTPPPPPFPHHHPHQGTAGGPLISWWDPYFFLDILQTQVGINSPAVIIRTQEVAHLMGQLEAHASKRYSFVCNSLLVLMARIGAATGCNEIIKAADELSVPRCGSSHYALLAEVRRLVNFCAEVTCQYQRPPLTFNNAASFPLPPHPTTLPSTPPLLNGEWLGAFKALCCPTHHMHHQHQQQQHPHFASGSPHTVPPGNANFVTVARNLVRSFGEAGRVDKLMLLYDALAQLCLTLVLDHVFSLEDFIKHVALPSLLAAACPPPGGGGPAAGPFGSSRSTPGTIHASSSDDGGAPDSSSGGDDDLTTTTTGPDEKVMIPRSLPGPAAVTLIKFNVQLGDRAAESGARLTCYLLFRLFKSFAPHAPLSSWTLDDGMRKDAKPAFGSRRKVFADIFTETYERQILISYQHNISIGALLAVFKALVLASCIPVNNSFGSERRRKKMKRKREKARASRTSHINPYPEFVDIGEMLGLRFNRFSQEVLLILTDQEWVKELFLKDPEGICSDQLLLDPLLSHKQASKLLHLICYPKGLPKCPAPHQEDSDLKRNVARILYNLDHWTLRVSYLELALMIKQQGREQDVNFLYDVIARTTVQIFQQQSEFTSDNSPVRYGTAFTHSLFSRLKQGTSSSVFSRVSETRNWKNCQGHGVEKGAANSDMGRRRKRGRPPGKATFNSKKKVLTGFPGSASPQNKSKYSPNPVATTSPSKLLAGNAFSKRSPLDYSLPGQQQQSQPERVEDLKSVSHQDAAASSSEQGCGSEEEDDNTYSRNLEEHLSTDSSHFADQSVIDGYLTEDGAASSDYEPGSVKGHLGAAELSPYAANTSGPHSNNTESRLFSPVEQGQQCPVLSPLTTATTNSAKKQGDPGKVTKFRDRRQHGIWLVAPLIGKLPAGVRGRVLKYAGQVLESGTHWATSSLNKLEREKNAQRSCSLLNHRPFFLLIKTCLTGPRKASPFSQYNPPSIGNQPTSFGSAPGSGLGSNLHNPTSLEVVALENGAAPDQRDHLLGSLHSQLNQLLRTSVEDRHVLWLPENARARSELREACRLRLSLVADMLDLVIKGGNALSSSSTSSTNNLVADWCCLLIQIMANDVVMSSGPSLIDPTNEESPSSSRTYCEEEASISVPLSTRFTLLSGAGESNTGSHKSLFYMVFDLLATLVTSSLVNFSPSAPNNPILANATMFCNPNLNPNTAASNLFGGSPLSYSTFRAPSAGSAKTDGGQESLKLKFVAIEEAQKKAYHTLCKKLKKEVADKLDTQRLEILKILFPLPRKTEKIIVSDKWSERGSSHHMAGMRDQMIGLKPTEAVYVNPWELIEGLPKSIGGPLSLTWWHANKTSGFGPLSQVEDYRSLLLHTHHLVNRASLGSPDYFSRPLENLPEMHPSELPYGDDIDYATGEWGEGRHYLTSPHSFGLGPLSTDSPHLIPDKNVHLTPTARGSEDANYAQHQGSSGLHHLSPHMGQTHAPRQDHNLMVDQSTMGSNAYHQTDMIPYSSACNLPPGISPNKSATNNVGESVVGDRGIMMMEQHSHQHHLLQPNPHFSANPGALYDHQPQQHTQQHAPSMYGTGPIESMINNASMRPPSEANFGIQGLRPTSRLQHAPGPPSYGIPTPRYKKSGGAGDGMADLVPQSVATNMAGNAPLKKPKQTRRRRQPRASAPNATKATNKASVSVVQSQPSVRPEITAVMPRGSGMTAKQQGLNISNIQSSQGPMSDMHQTFARNNPQNEYNWPGDYGEPRMDNPSDSRYGNPMYERQVGNGMTESKAALSSMLRSKHPVNSMGQPPPNAALLGSAPGQASQNNPKSVIFAGSRARGPVPYRVQQQPQHPSFGAGAAPISRNQMGPGGPRYQYTGQSGSGTGSLENVGPPPQYHPYPGSNLRSTETYGTLKEVPVQNPGPYGDQYGHNQPRKLMPVNYPQATAMTSDVGSRSYAPEPGYNFTAGPGCESVNRSKYGQAGGRGNVKCPDPTASSNIFDQFDFDNDDSTKAPQIDHSALFSTRGGRDGMALQQGYGQTYEDAANSQKNNKIYGDSGMKRPPSYSSFAGSQSLTDKKATAQAPKVPSAFMQHDNRNVAGNQQFTPRAGLAGGGPPRVAAQGAPYHVPDQNIYGQQQVYPPTGSAGGGGPMLSNALGSTIGYSQNPQGDMNRPNAQQQQQNPNYGQNSNFYNSGAPMPASHAPFYPNHAGNMVNVNQQQSGQQHANGNNNFYNNPNMQPNRFINDGQNYYQN